MNKYCDFCSNSFVNGIDPEYDGSSTLVGLCDTSKGYRLSLDAAGLSNPPVCIKVTVWDNNASYKGSDGAVVDVAEYAPKYCPECGRRIKENDKFREYLKKKNEEREKNKNVLDYLLS